MVKKKDFRKKKRNKRGKSFTNSNLEKIQRTFEKEIL